MHNKNAAPTPPMGWNSWDCHGAQVEEHQLLANAAVMAEKLLPYGWRYVVCDIQWANPMRGPRREDYPPFAPLCMDAYGRLLPAPSRFPSAAGGAGFADIAAEIHALGLKFGIHIMRGIPRQAVHARLPVPGTEYTADNIAQPHNICRWNGDMYGLDCRHSGAQAYYDSIFQLYAAWGVDFVKVDDIARVDYQPGDTYAASGEVELIRRAIDNCGRGMVLSLSPGPAPLDSAWHLAKFSNMWRLTDDMWDDWPLVRDMFSRCEKWQRHVSPGCWPDCDMLPLGRLCFHRQPGGRPCRLTREEQRTLMTLWCVFRSPLFMGGELTCLDAWTLSLLTNAAVVAVNQRGEKPYLAAKSGDFRAWVNADGDSRHVALFNLGDAPGEFSLPLGDIGMRGVSVRDLWANADVGAADNALSLSLPPHGCALYRLTGAANQ